MGFNLLTEAWIPVLRNDGTYGKVGIREAFTQAGNIRQIAASNPMDRVAVIRFLLAVVYWCKGGAPEATTDPLSNALPPEWFAKLDDHRECFELFGKDQRFYQYRAAGARTEKKLSANYLVQEVPTGTNKWHFRHSTDEKDGLCPACCAIGLLRLPAFATSGGRGKPPGINAKPPVYVVPVGPSLAATLRLSWEPTTNLGMPAWEEPGLKLPKSGPVPLLAGLTWVPRRVWLNTPGGPEAHCICCGAWGPLVRLTVFAPIGSAKVEGAARTWRDPHVIYEEDRKGEVTALHAASALALPDAAAAQWTRIVRGILARNRPDEPCRLLIVGFSTVQNDKYIEAGEYTLSWPSSPRDTEAPAEKCRQWDKEAKSLALALRPVGEKGTRRRHVEIPPMIAAVRAHVESNVAGMAGKLLIGGAEAWEQAAAQYPPMMAIIAKSLAPGYAVAAVQRRRGIGYAKPDMASREEAKSKRTNKKGGSQ